MRAWPGAVRWHWVICRVATPSAPLSGLYSSRGGGRRCENFSERHPFQGHSGSREPARTGFFNLAQAERHFAALEAVARRGALSQAQGKFAHHQQVQVGVRARTAARQPKAQICASARVCASPPPTSQPASFAALLSVPARVWAQRPICLSIAASNAWKSVANASSLRVTAGPALCSPLPCIKSKRRLQT